MADLLPKKYTIVQAANGDYYAVTNDEGEAQKMQKLSASQSALIQAHGAAEDYLSRMLMLTPLGSGVKVRLPKIFDEQQ